MQSMHSIRARCTHAVVLHFSQANFCSFTAAKINFWTRVQIAGAVHSRSKSISLRLLALILCSNCSNTTNLVLQDTVLHYVSIIFRHQRDQWSLLHISHAWSRHFIRCHDSCTPPPKAHNAADVPWNDVLRTRSMLTRRCTTRSTCTLVGWVTYSKSSTSS